MKQITDNSSTKTDSCQKGWRLLYILSAYYRCSEVLKPYLLWFLQDVCNDPTLHFQGIARACEQNLRKTFQFGGRCGFPGNMELKAMVAGRSSKRQLVLLPGGIEKHLKIKTCSVALDVIEEICYEMGLHRPEAFNEYIIFAVTSQNQNVRPLNKKEYILDVVMEMEQVDSDYMFWYRRVIWSQPLKFDNELYVTMHYNQRRNRFPLPWPDTFGAAENMIERDQKNVKKSKLAIAGLVVNKHNAYSLRKPTSQRQTRLGFLQRSSSPNQFSHLWRISRGPRSCKQRIAEESTSLTCRIKK
ncbi:unconventional myosin-XV-like [Heteronotia binoei]|uniref:unconventional myosin-XV-like n=1 Tax=Heteronotia binoei TaxID=13085 RepID=UPI00292D0B83|nr:unconventional myosin-XV-like [Heteronotia binoei]